MSCQLTGMFAHWTLTAAQDGTFVDLEMGMEPTPASRPPDRTRRSGSAYFRQVERESLDALREAARERVA